MIKVGSDFSGVGAFEQALNRLGIKHNTLFACDIDRYARTTFVHNYGEPKYFPEDVYDREIPKETLDIYMTSPPCQSFSLAGHRKGEDDHRGILFYNSHEFIKKNKPRYFIFENVKGLLSDDKGHEKDKIGRTFRLWLDYLGGKSVNGNPLLFPHEESVPYHVYYQILNAKDYGIPQNRERVFIIGIRDDEDNHFRFPKKEHLVRRLKDVLDENVDEKYYLSDKMISYFYEHKKVNKERGNGFKFEPKGGEDVGASVLTKSGSRPTDNYVKEGFIKQDTQVSQVFSEKGTSPTLSAGTHGYAIGYVKTHNLQRRSAERPAIAKDKNAGGSGHLSKDDGTSYCVDASNLQAVEIKIGAVRGRKPDDLKKEDNYKQTLEINKEDVSNTLSTVQKDNLVVSKNYVQWDTSGKGYKSQQDRAYFEDGFMGTLSASNQSGNKHNVLTDSRIRRLTPRECFRLMDFPEDFKLDAVSETQAYKQAGNSICVGVLAKIIDKLKL
jgi:DNA (cytosine-5)-methyltransferase 1